MIATSSWSDDGYLIYLRKMSIISHYSHPRRAPATAYESNETFHQMIVKRAVLHTYF